LASTFRFFVLSPEEYGLVKQHKAWEDFQTAQDEKWTNIIVVAVASALGVILLWRGIVKKLRRE
jgi:hypothetical protein